ncbi:MAG TPA: DegT/DnrJ/EryC1/StrS family aminotransferase, partial [Steroidobacteraceae bacterium]|nr:DegT/DnrJ/EryC1/StrS family aminotransferase [Steroidobacteraceae bacterium]
MNTTAAFAPWPFFADDERAAVDAVLQSGRVNYWTGDEGRSFEREFQAHAGSRHAIAMANGTVALEAALAACGVGEGAEVITSSRTFIASASAAVMRGAVPVVADVDPDSQNVTAETIARQLTPRTRAIIPVHLAGWPCEMDAIMDLARAHGLSVIEDCAQATGAAYRGRPVGTLGQAGAFSFCQDKILTTGGEGGMLLTDDAELWSRVWALKDHGKSYDAVYNRQHAPGYRWLHESFGTNWRMTEMQSAIGRVQLRKLDAWVAKRTANAEFLARGLGEVRGLRVPRPPAHVKHAWYKFYAFVEPAALRQGWTRDRIMSEVSGRGVPCYSGSCSE